MQKEDWNKNLLRSKARNQRQQVEPRRDKEDHSVRDKIQGQDSVKNRWHVCHYNLSIG